MSLPSLLFLFPSHFCFCFPISIQQKVVLSVLFFIPSLSHFPLPFSIRLLQNYILPNSLVPSSSLPLLSFSFSFRAPSLSSWQHPTQISSPTFHSFPFPLPLFLHRYFSPSSTKQISLWPFSFPPFPLLLAYWIQMGIFTSPLSLSSSSLLQCLNFLV